MRRSLLLLALVSITALMFAAAAFARGHRTAGDFQISASTVEFGASGTGTMIGTLASGQITIRANIRRGHAAPVALAGDCHLRQSRTSWSCSGSNIRFSVLGGSFSISIRHGSGLNASIVGSGTATMRGEGGLTLNGRSYPLGSRWVRARI